MPNVYKAGLKGLLTETNPADTPMDTMLDCADVVVSKDNTVESRHGINTTRLFRQTTSWTTQFNFASSQLSIYKIEFDGAVSGNTVKYVTLNGTIGSMMELNSPSLLSDPLTVNSSSFGAVLSNKPIGFTFDQSFYIVNDSGWLEMKKDVLNSGSTGVKKLIQFPPFTDIDIQSFQDTQDFSTNWLDIDKKVGIRFTYVWNTRYNDETPREVESEPSQIFEVLHPMALRTQARSSTLANTLVEKSRIRIRVGSQFLDGYLPFTNYVTTANNNRRFFLRVYRTKQANISDALPTEYYQAFPDIEIGATTKIAFAPSAVDTTTNLIDFGSDSAYWKNGDVVRYVTFGTEISPLISGSVDDQDLYYLGTKTSNSFKIYNNSSFGSTGAIDLLTQGAGTQTFYRVLEANLTVNDDGILSLPQLYTNPNQDGEVNANAIPPIANCVVKYKNYHLAADIKEPVRAYVTLVKQPMVKNVVGTKTISAGTPTGNYTFSTFNTTGGASDYYGLTSNEFGVDSPFFRIYPPRNVQFSGAQTSVGGSSDLPINIVGAVTADSDIFFDVNYVQTSANLSFRFDGGTTITANVEPQYNRTSPYTRYTSLSGGYPYANPIEYDKNLEWLQFAGTLTKPGFGTLPFYSTGSTSGSTYLDLNLATYQGSSTPTVPTINTKGKKQADILSTGTSTITVSGNNLIIANVNFDISKLAEPGIIWATTSTGSGYISYKTITSTAPTTIQLNNVSYNGTTFITSGTSTLTYAFFIESSTALNAPFYFQYSPISATDRVTWTSGTVNGSRLLIECSPVPLTQYYNKPVGIYNSTGDANGYASNPLFLGNLARSPAQLLDLCVAKIVTDLNKQAAANNLTVKFVKTDTVGEFYVEYYGGNKIEAQITGDYHTYEPEIVRSNSTWTTLANFTKNNSRALSISRYNMPEVFPESSVLAPILLGNEGKAIVALARNTNNAYALKEDGIFRIIISGNSSVPRVDSVVTLDTTTFCQAAYSVQEINEEIIFLSQKGFISINGTSVDNISQEIKTEVKLKLQKAIANGLASEIRSWCNEEKRIYGCTIRDTTSTYTTYVLNTYTRQWTKFNLPVVDAVTDGQGKTFYAVGLLNTTLSGPGTLQQQIDAATVAPATSFYLTEEIHTDGINRNEVDQWDYKYTPASVSLGTGNQVVLTDNSSTLITAWAKLGGTTSDISNSGLSFFVGRSAHYQKAGVYYSCTFVSRTSNTCTIEFSSVPAGITTVSGTDGLYAGVPSTFTLNPSNLGTPDTNKVFTEFQLHTVESIQGLSMQFTTDSRSDYSNPRYFTTSATNRTVYRTYIPTEMMRGRWLVRKINHSTPGERLQASGQSLSVRDTLSTAVQKANR